MLLIPIERLVPGEKLAKPVYSNENRILVSTKTELTNTIIRRLQELGVSHVYVQDKRTEDLQFEDILSEEARMQAVSHVKKSFHALRDADQKDWHRIASAIRDFRSTFEMILSEVESKRGTLLHLTSIYAKDSYLFTHSVNVGIYATVIGLSLKLPSAQIMDLGVGAILHDIGKIQIPNEILNKQGALTTEEYEIMKTHTTLGYNILRQSHEVSLLSAHCALQHHERLNGTGYPRQLFSEDLHLYGRIVGICDMYDALVSNRIYRRAQLPHTALEMLFGSATAGQFDMQLVENFQKHVAVYPIGLPVKLSTGERGVVASVDSACSHRPTIRVLYGAEGELLSPFERDLSQELTVMIDDCENVLEISRIK